MFLTKISLSTRMSSVFSKHLFGTIIACKLDKYT